MTDNGTATETPAARLAYLRRAIEAEDISYGEIAELQGLAEYIDPSDVVLLEWAGVPEFPPEHGPDCALDCTTEAGGDMCRAMHSCDLCAAEATSADGLAPFLVTLANGQQYSFAAENAAHARDQAENAEPNNPVVSIGRVVSA